MRFPDFTSVLSVLKDRMRTAPIVHTERWQGVDISKKPEAATHELMNVFFTVQVPVTLEELVKQIDPNLPWADKHFDERVSGEPLNPPPSWREWPWGHSASNFLGESGQFNHTYPERFWPKYAGMYPIGEPVPKGDNAGEYFGNFGIRYNYGDLNDVVRLLEREPLTRQAYLPVWFPEDTGAVHKDRTPCTLGYHFMIRAGKLHCFYYIRSCEMHRHFRDDIYLAVRLQLWVIDQLRGMSPAKFQGLVAGDFAMHIGSLHMFRNDYIAEFGA